MENTITITLLFTIVIGYFTIGKVLTFTKYLKRCKEAYRIIRLVNDEFKTGLFNARSFAAETVGNHLEISNDQAKVFVDLVLSNPRERIDRIIVALDYIYMLKKL